MRTVSLLAVFLVGIAVPALASKPKPAAPVLPGAGQAVGKKPMRALELLYGDDHVFGITPPEGWAIDDSSGLGQKLRTVMYPKGQTWKTAKTVMYVSPIHQDPKQHRTLQQMVDRDVASFRKANPRGIVTVAPNVTTYAKQVALVRYFAPNGGKPLEAVAYYDDGEHVQLVVLSAQDPADFEKVLPAFLEMAKTYQYVGGGMRTPTMKG